MKLLPQFAKLFFGARTRCLVSSSVDSHPAKNGGNVLKMTKLGMITLRNARLWSWRGRYVIVPARRQLRSQSFGSSTLLFVFVLRSSSGSKYSCASIHLCAFFCNGASAFSGGRSVSAGIPAPNPSETGLGALRRLL